jgi:hypothetical protein
LRKAKRKQIKVCLFVEKMGPINFVWQFLLVLLLCVVRVHVQANGWLNAHATFYGTNQSPTSLGKLFLTEIEITFYIQGWYRIFLHLFTLTSN